MLVHIITTADPQILDAISDARKVQLFTDALQRCQTDVGRAVASLSVEGQHELHVHETIEAVVAGIDSVSMEVAIAGTSYSAQPPAAEPTDDDIEAVDDTESMVPQKQESVADPARASVSPTPNFVAIEVVIDGCNSVSMASKEHDAPSSAVTPALPKPRRQSKANKTACVAKPESASLASQENAESPSTEPKTLKRRSKSKKPADSEPSASTHQITGSEPPTQKRRSKGIKAAVAGLVSASLASNVQTADTASIKPPAAPKRRNSTIRPTVAASTSARPSPNLNFDAIEAVIAGRDSASLAAQKQIHVTEPETRSATPSNQNIDATQPVLAGIPMHDPNPTQTYTNGNVFSDLRPVVMETQSTIVPSSQSNPPSDDSPDSLSDYVQTVSELLDENAINLVRFCNFLIC